MTTINLTATEVAARKENLRACFAEKLEPSKFKNGNVKKAEKFQRFFTLNEKALDLLATENADIKYLGNQLYATEKLRDMLRVAIAGHTDIEMSSMQHFVLRSLKSFENLKAADARFDINNVIDCAISSDVKPKAADGLILSNTTIKGESTVATQRTQVINVLRVMRILVEGDDRTVNLTSDFAQMILAALEDYDGACDAE